MTNHTAFTVSPRTSASRATAYAPAAATATHPRAPRAIVPNYASPQGEYSARARVGGGFRPARASFGDADGITCMPARRRAAAVARCTRGAQTYPLAHVGCGGRLPRLCDAPARLRGHCATPTLACGDRRPHHLRPRTGELRPEC